MQSESQKSTDTESSGLTGNKCAPMELTSSRNSGKTDAFVVAELFSETKTPARKVSDEVECGRSNTKSFKVLENSVNEKTESRKRGRSKTSCAKRTSKGKKKCDRAAPIKPKKFTENNSVLIAPLLLNYSS
jgi:hypothetical protein